MKKRRYLFVMFAMPEKIQPGKRTPNIQFKLQPTLISEILPIDFLFSLSRSGNSPIKI